MNLFIRDALTAQHLINEDSHGHRAGVSDSLTSVDDRSFSSRAYSLKTRHIRRFSDSCAATENAAPRPARERHRHR